MATHLRVIGGHEDGFAKTNAPIIGGLLRRSRSSCSRHLSSTRRGRCCRAKHYYAEPYLSPFYSPVLFTRADRARRCADHHAWFGAWPSWWPQLPPRVARDPHPGLPGAFRFTCYYYRKAYYRAFAGSPPGCAVGPLARQAQVQRRDRGCCCSRTCTATRSTSRSSSSSCSARTRSSRSSSDGQFGIGVGSIILTHQRPS